MEHPFSGSAPKAPLAEGLYIDIKTRSVCDRRKVDPWTYAGDWSTDICVVGFAIADDEVNLWHRDDPVAPELTQAIRSGSPIISYDAPFHRAVFTDIMRPRYGWPIPPLSQNGGRLPLAAHTGCPALGNPARAPSLGDAKEHKKRGRKAGRYTTDNWSGLARYRSYVVDRNPEPSLLHNPGYGGGYSPHAYLKGRQAALEAWGAVVERQGA